MVSAAKNYMHRGCANVPRNKDFTEVYGGRVSSMLTVYATKQSMTAELSNRLRTHHTTLASA